MMPEASLATANAEARELIGGIYAVESALGEGRDGRRVPGARYAQRATLALKRLQAKQESAALLLFEREYFTLSELAHPRIIEVYDYGVDADGAYYTMELLDGADLREKRKNLGCPKTCALLVRRRFLARDSALAGPACIATSHRAT